MNDDNPFSYPLKTYLLVLAVACAGGLVKHLNSTNKINLAKLCIDIITAGFTGVMTFWFCQAGNIHGPVAAILIATGGLMGNKAWHVFENFYKLKTGSIATSEPTAEKEPIPVAKPKRAKEVSK